MAISITDKCNRCSNVVDRRGVLKPGYVVKLRNGELRMVCQVGVRDALILVDTDGKWNYSSNWDTDLTAKQAAFDLDYKHRHRDFDIIEVYGFVLHSKAYGHADTICTDGRGSVWIRKDPKKLTVAEIEELLGYKIEIVAEEKQDEN